MAERMSELLVMTLRLPFPHDSPAEMRRRGVRGEDDAAEEQEHQEDLGLGPAEAAARVEAVGQPRPPWRRPRLH